MDEWIIKEFFSRFFGPASVLLLMVCGFCMLFGFIIHKIRSNEDSVSFYKSKGKKLLKIFLAIELIPSAIILVILFFSQNARNKFCMMYRKIDDLEIGVDIEGWIMHHEFIFKLCVSLLMSLLFLADFLQKNDAKLSIKTLACYLLISTPLLCGLLYLLSNFNILTIIVIIGLPGALILLL